MDRYSNYYSKELADKKDNEPFESGSQQTARGALDFEEFTNKMTELLKKAWGDNWGKFTHDEPTGTDPSLSESEQRDYIKQIPVITYDTHKRIRSESHPSLDPVRYDRIKDADRPGEVIDLFRMWFDLTVEFKIYHETNLKARELMTDFEDFIWRYKSYFKEIGISEIIFMSEEKPQFVDMYGIKLPERRLRYLIRMERISKKIVSIVDRIDTDVTNVNPDKQRRGVNVESTNLNGNTILDHYNKQFRP